MLIRRTTSFVGIVGAEVATLVLLTRLGSYGAGPADWSQVGTWLADTPPEDALVAAVRLLALGLAWWLTASTLLYAVARSTQAPSLIRGVRWVTWPPLRRVIDGVLATTIVAGSTFGGGRVAMAQPVQVGPVVVQLDQQSDPSAVAANKPAYQPRPAGDGSTRAEPEEASATTTSPASASTSTTTTKPRQERSTTSPLTPPKREAEHAPASAVYVVQPGDNLWKISHHHVATATGRPMNTISTKDVGRYWVELVETNRPFFRSDDPDLIYPGETISLPPWPSTP